VNEVTADQHEEFFDGAALPTVIRFAGMFLTSSKNVWVFRRMCLSSVSSKKFFFSISSLVFTSLNSFSSFSKVA